MPKFPKLLLVLTLASLAAGCTATENALMAGVLWGATAATQIGF
jgi:hypothetical protein